MSGRLWPILALLAIAAEPVVARVAVTASHGYALVPVEIDGVAHPFVLDTGAEGSAVYPDFARDAHLPAGTPDIVVGQTGQADVPTRTIDRLTLDERRAGPIRAVELPARRDGIAVAGIVGLDVIGSYLLDLDMPRAAVSLHDRVTVHSVTHGLGRSVRATRIRGGLLAVPVVLDGVAGLAILDTGARETRVNNAFAHAAGLIDTGATPGTVRGATQVAVTTRTARVRDAAFLGQHRRATTVRVVDLPVFADFGLADRPAMLLGLDWLATHRLIVDFVDARIWCPPSPS